MRFDLTTLRIFIAVYNLESLTKAADQEHIAPSAVSKRINDLEAELGVQLFYRHPRGVSATPAGEAMVVHTRRIFDILNDMTADLSLYTDGRSGQVRISAHSSAVHQYLPADIVSFNRAYPDVRVVLSEETSVEVLQSLLDGVSDIGVIAAHVPLPDCVSAFRYRVDQLVALLPPEDPLAARDSIDFFELRDHSMIGLELGSSLQALLMEAAQSLGFQLKNSIKVVTFGSAVSMAAAGLGVTIVPVNVARSFKSAERLVGVPLRDAWARRELAVCARTGQKTTACVRLMLEHLSRSAEAYPNANPAVPNE
ncbi:LysR family transcriptional regulator [Pikeienuella sp. HZG-20]|uniref:LysR family transcriptional regulator n=1 Tax=Paludibacillus litoralis TaxID=3133267 RepID=UPI0030EE3476